MGLCAAKPPTFSDLLLCGGRGAIVAPLIANAAIARLACGGYGETNKGERWEGPRRR